MRIARWRMLVTVLLCVLNSAVPAQAQEWFRQRAFDGRSAPVGPASTKSPDSVGSADYDALLPSDARTPTETTEVFQASGLPTNILDSPGAAITSTIAVPARTNWRAVRVSLNITHPSRGHLRVILTAPGGATFTLSNLAGGTADDLVITDQVLNVTAGASLQGNWVLSVADLTTGDTGRLNSWALTVISPGSYALIDLTMSIESNPLGDNNGNAQGNPGSEQDKWERIIQYFADAVYEMTNGAHRIREVRVFSKSKNFGQADIRWGTKGHPHVPNNGGVGVAGGHVAMFEIFEKGGPNDTDYNMLADEPGSGYTMAHEWAHFFLGLYDEYNPACGAATVSIPLSIMNSQWNARGGDTRWLNFSIQRQQGGNYQDTLLNCQHYAYGTAAWPVLARPVSSDPTDQTSRRYQSLGPRIYYPEFTAAAPIGTASPGIDLPNVNARGSLDIVWMLDRQIMDIVIDRSGSMTGDKLPQAKTAAKLLVDQAVLNQTRLGITIFDDAVTSLFPVTLVATEAIRTQIKTAIDGIALGGSTAIGEAAASSLAKLQAVNAPGENKVVFLLSDGQSNTGRSPLTVIPDYTAAHIPLFTFGFGSDADTVVLSQMANGTGGRFYFSPTSLAAISAAFQDANQTASSSPGLGAGSLTPSATTPVTVRIPVDSSLDRIQISVVYSGTAPANSIRLTNPAGQVISPTSTSVAGAETLLFFNVGQPATGNWQLAASAAGITFNYSTSGIQKAVGYDINTGLRGSGFSITTPGPVVIETTLSHRLPIAGATVSARITNPAGVSSVVQLLDDGVYPDLLAGNGQYTGLVLPGARGSYSLSVQFSNPGLSARETYAGSTASPNTSGGLVPVPADVTIAEDFTRSQTLQFSIDTNTTQIAPYFTTQPANQTVATGASVTFLVTALANPAATYQWQRKAASASSFSNLANGGAYSGVTTATLLLSTVSGTMTGDQFRCVVTNTVGPATSATGTLTVEGAARFMIGNRAGTLLTTSGASTPLQVGYGRIQPDAGSTTPSGIAIFGLRKNNVLVSETSVPASRPLTSGRIYAEIAGAVDTGLAMVNPNNSPATVSFFFTDSSGNDLGSGSTTIPANGHLAKFLQEPPYSSPPAFQGTFSFTSNMPLGVVALRGFTNERGNFLMSTLPVIDTTAPPNMGPQVVPHFVDGGGWGTQIFLVNPTGNTMTGSVQFAGDNGAAVNVTIAGQTNNSFSYSVPGRSAQRLATSGATEATLVGSVRIAPDSAGGAPTPLVVFSFKQAGTTVSEAGVPAISGTAFRMYVESSGTEGVAGNIQSGIAIANNESAAAAVTFELTNVDGSATGLPAPVSRNIPGNGHVGMFLGQLFPTVQNPFKGVLRISTTTARISVTGLRGRYNESQPDADFLITTTPPTVESNAPPTVELVFPHLADGDGYTTQFILFSGTAGQVSSGTLLLFDPNGQALNLMLR